MRKIRRALKEIDEPKNYVNKTVVDIIDKTINPNKDTKDCESPPNTEGQGEALPAPSEETCYRGLEVEIDRLFLTD